MPKNQIIQSCRRGFAHLKFIDIDIDSRNEFVFEISLLLDGSIESLEMSIWMNEDFLIHHIESQLYLLFVFSSVSHGAKGVFSTLNRDRKAVTIYISKSHHDRFSFLSSMTDMIPPTNLQFFYIGKLTSIPLSILGFNYFSFSILIDIDVSHFETTTERKRERHENGIEFHRNSFLRQF